MRAVANSDRSYPLAGRRANPAGISPNSASGRLPATKLPRASSLAGAAPDRATLTALQSRMGNQAVMRMLSRAAPSPASGVAVVQRQDAGTPGAGTATGGTGSGGGPTANLPWATSMLEATIEDSNNPQCLGTVQAGGGLRFSTNCANIKGPFCQPAGVAFNVDFFVDVINAPRPAGFTPPTVRVQLIFVNNAGAVTQNIDKKDSKPKYNSPGTPLDPAFGHALPFSTSESGWLHIHLQLADPGTGATVDYNDRVTFTVTPCT